MNNIYIIHFGMGQKAIKAYECPLPACNNWKQLKGWVKIPLPKQIEDENCDRN